MEHFVGNLLQELSKTLRDELWRLRCLWRNIFEDNEELACVANAHDLFWNSLLSFHHLHHFVNRRDLAAADLACYSLLGISCGSNFQCRTPRE